ncbi:hypothetical protein [Desulfofundulus sp. TPOSR]|uniref:hypothetical protein n=1 Tax=Desulfofundulus sp. TPOSR TaxID=2714340 RepID=UPI001A9BDC63|nr:hypothetical protein [Desulfofundulus sp. TPOSR]
MNFVFMREGYPPVVFKKEERERYLTSLEEASVTGNMMSFLELVRDALLTSLETFLSVVRPAGHKPVEQVRNADPGEFAL